MIELSGWIGSFLFATCGIPMAWESYKNGHSEGITLPFLWMWWWGEIFILIYTVPHQLWPLIINYIFNLLLVSIVIWFKYQPRKSLTPIEK